MRVRPKHRGTFPAPIVQAPGQMRVLIFHGYLLRGTGSNVYNANLAAALTQLGHEVHLLCQDRAPEELAFVDACGDWDEGELAVETLRGPVRCTAYRPDIAGLLPVYVSDRYDGVEARPFHELSEEELDRYLERNVAAVAEVAERAQPDIALANHLVMGPVILRRALAGAEVPYAVKIHGSALEYTVKPHPRFLPHAREGLAAAAGILVGSGHTAASLWAAIGDRDIVRRTRLGPPGVDVEAFRPRPPAEAAERLSDLVRRLEDPGRAQADDDSAFARDEAAAAAALRTLDAASAGNVVFVGKLIVSKGIDLMLAAWPLVLGAVPDARLLVVGFGAWRETAERLLTALAAGDLDSAREIAAAGRETEGGPRRPLVYLEALLDSVESDEHYWEAASRLPECVAFAGRLEHDELVDVLGACSAMVVPSTFPEAFGMVAAEAAACGVLPLSARHSGLAEVTEVLADAVPAEAREWLGFELGPRAARQIAERLTAFLSAPAGLRAATAESLAAVARERYSWSGVARGVIAAAAGRLDELPSPPPPPGEHPSAGLG